MPRDNKAHKDYTKRATVIRYLPYWQRFLKSHGKEETKMFLTTTGRTKMLKAKDLRGLIQALGLEEI